MALKRKITVFRHTCQVLRYVFHIILSFYWPDRLRPYTPSRDRAGVWRASRQIPDTVADSDGTWGCLPAPAPPPPAPSPCSSRSGLDEYQSADCRRRKNDRAAERTGESSMQRRACVWDLRGLRKTPVLILDSEFQDRTASFYPRLSAGSRTPGPIHPARRRPASVPYSRSARSCRRPPGLRPRRD